jgi:hypothetical protein
MKKSLIATSLCLSLAMPVVSHASVMVSGSIEFDFSNFDSPPAPYFYGYGGDYYGSVRYRDGSNLSYPFDPNGVVTLNSITYQDARSGAYGAVSGAWNSTTGAGSIALSAIDIHSDSTATEIDLMIGAPFRNLNYAALPTFSYSFDVSGSKEFADEAMSLYIQLQIGYSYTDPNNGWTEVKLYSDYCNVGDSCRTNWVAHLSDVGNDALTFAEDGSRTFSGFVTHDGLPHDWFIEYGLGAYAYTNNGTSETSIPEPASLLLVNLGILVIAGLRRRVYRK